MTVWDEVVGQPDAVRVLARSAAADSPGHAWLITGPPGSGRSVAARAFARSLLCPHSGCGACSTCATVLAGSHPDVHCVNTEGVTIDIATIRELVNLSQRHAAGSYRVIIVEDADRMTERTSNVLLKALEEPPPDMVWVLCAPGPDDVLPTIRSRCRSVRLRVPDAGIVAAHLMARDGVSEQVAVEAAHAAQSHIGVARRLATRESARERRAEITSMVLGVHRLGEAVMAAARLNALAEADAEDATSERDAAEREQLLKALGVEGSKTIPPALRAQVRKLEAEQKRRVSRTQADVLDRALVDMQSVLRDVLMVQVGADVDAVNASLASRIADVAARTTAPSTLHRLDAIGVARRRITGPIRLNRLMALEAMMVALMIR